MILKILNEIFDHSDVVKLLSDALMMIPLGMNDGGYIANDIIRNLMNFGVSAHRERIGFWPYRKKNDKNRHCNAAYKIQQVFGYYIEMSKLVAAQAPQQYVRKQTLVNVERFIIPELKSMRKKFWAQRRR